MTRKIRSLLIVLVCFLSSNVFYAYSWRFSNLSSKFLLLAVKHLASNKYHYGIVVPDKSILFSWPIGTAKAGFCFGGFKWRELPTEIINNKDLFDNNLKIVDNKKIDALFFSSHAQFELYDGIIQFLPNKLFDDTVKAAANIGKGIDSLICLGQVQKNGYCPFVIKKSMKWIAEKIKRSICRSRDITIVENKDGTIEFSTLAD